MARCEVWTNAKRGRNDAYTYGSGRKWKQCHGTDADAGPRREWAGSGRAATRAG